LVCLLILALQLVDSVFVNLNMVVLPYSSHHALTLEYIVVDTPIWEIFGFVNEVFLLWGTVLDVVVLKRTFIAVDF